MPYVEECSPEEKIPSDNSCLNSTKLATRIFLDMWYFFFLPPLSFQIIGAIYEALRSHNFKSLRASPAHLHSMEILIMIIRILRVISLS